jgi:hypothetical protein
MKVIKAIGAMVDAVSERAEVIRKCVADFLAKTYVCLQST